MGVLDYWVANNNNRLLPVAPNFVLSVSFGRPRPVHAVSNTNWEGVGVAPSGEAPPTQALEIAQSLPLNGQASSQVCPTRIAPEFRDGILWVTRPNRPTARLSPLTADGMIADYGVDSLRYRFTDQTMELLRADEPAPRVFPRG